MAPNSALNTLLKWIFSEYSISMSSLKNSTGSAGDGPTPRYYNYTPLPPLLSALQPSLNPPRPINKMFYLIVWISSAPPPVDTHSGFMETITLFIISFPWLLTSERTLHCVLESPSYFKPPSSPCLRAVIVLIPRAPADKREADWAVHLAGVSEHLDLWANKYSILCLLTITNNRGDPLHLHLTINSGV